jgi:hypothetical protein
MLPPVNAHEHQFHLAQDDYTLLRTRTTKAVRYNLHFAKLIDFDLVRFLCPRCASSRPRFQTEFQVICSHSAEVMIAIGFMARRLRVEHPGAIHHLMARGNRRQDIVHDDADRDRLIDYLGRASDACGGFTRSFWCRTIRTWC